MPSPLEPHPAPAPSGIVKRKRGGYKEPKETRKMGWFSGQVVERGNKSKVSFFPWKKEKGAKSETKYKRRAKRERAKGCPGGEKS